MSGESFRIEELPRCLSNWRSFNYLFAWPVSRPFVNHLLDLGQSELRENYPRPLFKVREAGRFYLIGVIGTTRIKVDYNEKDMESTKHVIEARFVEAHRNPDSGTETY
jgi:hypothetical protein